MQRRITIETREDILGKTIMKCKKMARNEMKKQVIDHDEVDFC